MICWHGEQQPTVGELEQEKSELLLIFWDDNDNLDRDAILSRINEIEAALRIMDPEGVRC